MLDKPNSNTRIKTRAVDDIVNYTSLSTVLVSNLDLTTQTTLLQLNSTNITGGRVKVEIIDGAEIKEAANSTYVIPIENVRFTVTTVITNGTDSVNLGKTFFGSVPTKDADSYSSSILVTINSANSKYKIGRSTNLTINITDTTLKLAGSITVNIVNEISGNILSNNLVTAISRLTSKIADTQFTDINRLDAINTNMTKLNETIGTISNEDT